MIQDTLVYLLGIHDTGYLGIPTRYTMHNACKIGKHFIEFLCEMCFFVVAKMKGYI